MAICEKCGKKYFSRNCPYCNKKKGASGKIIIGGSEQKKKSILSIIIEKIENIIFIKEETKKENNKKKEIGKKIINETKDIFNDMYLGLKYLKNKEKEERKRAFEANRKKRYKDFMKENKKKGIEYEKYVGKYFENKGYKIIYNGIEKGLKDEGIDLIAIKNNEAIFIQCKNWKKNNKNKITHKEISSFVGKTFTYTTKNQEYMKYKIKRLYIASNDIFDYSTKKYCKENSNIVKYLHLPIN